MWGVGYILFELVVGVPLLPGKSTKDMICMVFEVSGFPDREEFERVMNECEITKIDYDDLKNEKIKKKKIIKQLVSGYTNDPITIDLLSKLLQFEPKKKLTAEEALNHHCVKDFHNVEEEITCEHKIKIPLDDIKNIVKENIDKNYIKLYYKRKIEIRKKIN